MEWKLPETPSVQTSFSPVLCGLSASLKDGRLLFSGFRERLSPLKIIHFLFRSVVTVRLCTFQCAVMHLCDGV